MSACILQALASAWLSLLPRCFIPNIGLVLRSQVAKRRCLTIPTQRVTAHSAKDFQRSTDINPGFIASHATRCCVLAHP